MILHIPHSSRTIPPGLRDQFVLSDDELSAELDLMTDAYTDELFHLSGPRVVRFPFSRLVVDVERFADDAQEPMSQVGMGMIYTRTSSGRDLRRTMRPDERRGLVALYEAHHEALLREVEAELAATGHALIVDCHSFPSCPLTCDRDQCVPRPQFCIGTDPFHTPEALTVETALELEKAGYEVQLNQPYEGTLVPMAFWRKDRRVASMMIEVNRSLYIDGATGYKTGTFALLQDQMHSLLSTVAARAIVTSASSA